jgi:hypothetical protein
MKKGITSVGMDAHKKLSAKGEGRVRYEAGPCGYRPRPRTKPCATCAALEKKPRRTRCAAAIG